VLHPHRLYGRRLEEQPTRLGQRKNFQGKLKVNEEKRKRVSTRNEGGGRKLQKESVLARKNARRRDSTDTKEFWRRKRKELDTKKMAGRGGSGFFKRADESSGGRHRLLFSREGSNVQRKRTREAAGKIGSPKPLATNLPPGKEEV